MTKDNLLQIGICELGPSGHGAHRSEIRRGLHGVRTVFDQAESFYLLRGRAVMLVEDNGRHMP